MNLSLMILELGVVALGLGLLLLDLWTPPEGKRFLSCLTIAGLVFLLVNSFFMHASSPVMAAHGMYVMDGLALFFKRMFLAAALVVIVLAREDEARLSRGLIEYHALVLFATAGMMWAASANHFGLLFVALELATIPFFVLIAFQRDRNTSLEAGIKYLILAGLATAFLVMGIALVYGASGTMGFADLVPKARITAMMPILGLGLLLVVFGLAFKIAAFPFQVWAPDVYQGAPAPTTAFLAGASKAVGFVLLLRLAFSAAPELASRGKELWMILAAVSILYGNLCAIPQRNLKRLMGYSSISNAGYLLLGVSVLNHAGQAAVVFYLCGYLFTVMAALGVITMVIIHTGADDFEALAGLHKKSPFLAATLAMAMVSLAGIPPLVGFFGKFLLIKAVVEAASTDSSYAVLAAVALIGVIISMYYYFNVVRAIYWPEAEENRRETWGPLSWPLKIALGFCLAFMWVLGIIPGPLYAAALRAVQTLGQNL